MSRPDPAPPPLPDEEYGPPAEASVDLTHVSADMLRGWPSAPQPPPLPPSAPQPPQPPPLPPSEPAYTYRSDVPPPLPYSEQRVPPMGGPMGGTSELQHALDNVDADGERRRRHSRREGAEGRSDRRSKRRSHKAGDVVGFDDGAAAGSSAAHAGMGGDAGAGALGFSAASKMPSMHRPLDVIREEHKAIKARLREYEIAFEAENGRKPRKRRDWTPVIYEYEQYASLREEEKAAVLASQVGPSPSGTRDA